MYDAIVVGARCAGSPTAMLLARKGFRVLLVDRATFPSDIPHGHLIHKGGPRRLKGWGLLDKLSATGCPPVVTQVLDFDGMLLVGRGLVVDGVALGYGPRRTVLDKILLDAAVDAGVDVREGFAVEEFLSDADTITGIRGKDVRTGKMVAEHARITIGADGRHSHLARAVQPPVYETVPTLLCYYFSYWSGVFSDALEVHVRNRRVILPFPTNDDLVAVFIGWPIDELQDVKIDIEGNFWKAANLVPELAERLREGRREERFYGATDLPNFFRKPYGPGWALVGDAGHHKDPFLALGIADAFRDAELLADAVADGLWRSRPMSEALAEYERRRNEMAMPDYRQNLREARFEPLPADARRLFTAIRGNQEETNRFLMARQGMIPSEEFFNPANLERIMGKARSE